MRYFSFFVTDLGLRDVALDILDSLRLWRQTIQPIVNFLLGIEDTGCYFILKHDEAPVGTRLLVEDMICKFKLLCLFHLVRHR